MKNIYLLICLFVAFNSTAQDQNFFKNSDDFFATYVENGLVKYQEVLDKPSDLNNLITQISEYLVAGKEPEEQKAFYTNAYNILVIKQIIDNYPIKGPLDKKGFFNATTFNVAGRDVTLDELEKDILFPAFPDPRLHFVLVCAAIGCPPIANYAFQPNDIDSLIDAKTREILNINWYVRVYKNHTQLSKVFEWYESDFINDTTDVKSFVNRYRDIKIPDDHEITTYEYDWLLNDAASSFRY
ncbi:MAG: DUF547 domain-containing protein [Cyclobacteriaceae bacterium]